VFAALAVVGLWASAETLAPRLELLRDRFTIESEGDIDPSLEERRALRDTYFSQIERLWFSCLSGYDGGYPHHFFLEFWIRFGIVGLAMAIAAALLIGALHLRQWKYDFSPTVFLILLQGIFTLLNAQTNLALEFQRNLWCAVGVSAGLIVEERRARFWRRGCGIIHHPWAHSSFARR